MSFQKAMPPKGAFLQIIFFDLSKAIWECLKQKCILDALLKCPWKHRFLLEIFREVYLDFYDILKIVVEFKNLEVQLGLLKSQ